MLAFKTIDDLEVKNKTVLVRVDLNVPMHAGAVTDDTRLRRQLPTIRELAKRGAKPVLLSHFGRPKGKFEPSLSLAPLVDALSAALPDFSVKFGVDCVGTAAEEAVAALKPGEILLLENLRFHAGEEANDPAFARSLAALGDFYVNDAFSASHRAHASVHGIAGLLPAAAGLLMQEELQTLGGLFAKPKRPMAAIVGGSKVSTKLEMLEHLIEKVDVLIVGGAMANTFLHAEGHNVGKSLCETEMKETARRILAKAKTRGCALLLPVDVAAASAFAPQAPCRIVPAHAIPADALALDIGPQTLALFARSLAECRTALWNGPMGAFETSPFDSGTVQLARIIAGLTETGSLRSVAGGGDTVAALTHAGLAGAFSYLSTAGGAFLEWMEGKELPGVAALVQTKSTKEAAHA